MTNFEWIKKTADVLERAVGVKVNLTIDLKSSDPLIVSIVDENDSELVHYNVKSEAEVELLLNGMIDGLTFGLSHALHKRVTKEGIRGITE